MCLNIDSFIDLLILSSNYLSNSKYKSPVRFIDDNLDILFLNPSEAIVSRNLTNNSISGILCKHAHQSYSI